jgi:hypothetical protein
VPIRCGRETHPLAGALAVLPSMCQNPFAASDFSSSQSVRDVTRGSLKWPSQIVLHPQIVLHQNQAKKHFRARAGDGEYGADHGGRADSPSRHGPRPSGETLACRRTRKCGPCSDFTDPLIQFHSNFSLTKLDCTGANGNACRSKRAPIRLSPDRVSSPLVSHLLSSSVIVIDVLPPQLSAVAFSVDGPLSTFSIYFRAFSGLIFVCAQHRAFASRRRSHSGRTHRRRWNRGGYKQAEANGRVDGVGGPGR